MILTSHQPSTSYLPWASHARWATSGPGATRQAISSPRWCRAPRCPRPPEIPRPGVGWPLERDDSPGGGELCLTAGKEQQCQKDSVRALIDEALCRWRRKGMLADNISVVITFLSEADTPPPGFSGEAAVKRAREVESVPPPQKRTRRERGARVMVDLLSKTVTHTLDSSAPSLSPCDPPHQPPLTHSLQQ